MPKSSQTQRMRQAKAVTKELLDVAGCGTPNCNHDHSVLYLHAMCHVGGATSVKYVKALQTIIVECYECGEEIVRIKL